ncbi:asparaginase [Labrys okinawensis]|uniref:Asparaginase n=1 Tax=Labrys okinawensis TaxID=346911 RepID=A0A2S9QFC3_9HYPH|nr:asparaginase [Labrys okinawensis]PRH88044.1 asparaginase [Labrys okinawensis]
MSNPILAELIRGGIVESRHSGAIAVSDPEGRIVLSLGDVTRPVFPRSAVKAFQALPLLESGAADKLDLTDAEIALAVSSHGGEPRHVETAAAMLAKAGRDAGTLECGVHAPSFRPAAWALLRAGEEPCALHNNCSGKHAGFVCLACATDRDPHRYIEATHPVMREVMGAVNEMSGAALTGDGVGIDGCSIPTQAAPLAGVARGFARFGTGAYLGPERAKAAARIRRAAAAEPFLVAGTKRFCTDIMTIFGERVFVKTGAEGVFCAAFPELGYGIALKCDDGGTRAAELMMAGVIAKLLPLSEDETEALKRFLEPVQKNWNGIEVGRLRLAGVLA